MNLNQLTIPSIDVERSIRFFQLLGLKLIVESLPNYARFQCPDGNTTFSIQKVEQLPIGDGIHIYFECENLDLDVKRLINHGIQFEEMPTDKDWLWREARLKDPDNNQLILFFAGENRMNPPWKIK